MNRHPQWRRHYYDLGVNLNEMTKVAEWEKSYNFILISSSENKILSDDYFRNFKIL